MPRDKVYKPGDCKQAEAVLDIYKLLRTQLHPREWGHTPMPAGGPLKSGPSKGILFSYSVCIRELMRTSVPSSGILRPKVLLASVAYLG